MTPRQELQNLRDRVATLREKKASSLDFDRLSVAELEWAEELYYRRGGATEDTLPDLKKLSDDELALLEKLFLKAEPGSDTAAINRELRSLVRDVPPPKQEYQYQRPRGEIGVD